MRFDDGLPKSIIMQKQKVEQTKNERESHKLDKMVPDVRKKDSQMSVGGSSKGMGMADSLKN